MNKNSITKIHKRGLPLPEIRAHITAGHPLLSTEWSRKSKPLMNYQQIVLKRANEASYRTFLSLNLRAKQSLTQRIHDVISAVQRARLDGTH